MRRKIKKRRRVLHAVGVCFIGLCFIIITGVVLWLARRLLPTDEVIDFHTYMALDPAVTGVIIEDRRLQPHEFSPPFMSEDDIWYLPVSLVKAHMDPFIFWDAYAQRLYITTADTVTTLSPEARFGTRDGERYEMNAPLRLLDDEPYLPLSFVADRYPFDLAYQSAYNMVIVTDQSRSRTLGTTVKKTMIRYRPDGKATVTREAAKGETMTLYEAEGAYTRVRTEDGLLGYVLTAALAVSAPIPGKPVVQSDSTDDDGQKIYLMWDLITEYRTNAVAMREALPDGLDVIAPTWFNYDAETGLLVATGDDYSAYVAWAQAQGCQVWAMLADTGYDNNHALVTDADARTRVIAQLADWADEWGLDGINIDFEYVREADAEYYIGFLRELAPALRRQQVLLSVDVYVPAAWSRYYSRDRVGQTADYVIVMTYDEHYAGSPESGPVASLPFVEKGVSDMLLEVPKEKLLMGLPFYNRVWREVLAPGAERESPQNYGMNAGRNRMTENGAVFDWDTVIGSYYAEYTAEEDGQTVLYRLWLEDARSIAAKLTIFDAYDIAGVAGWRRGLENDEVRALLGLHFADEYD